MGRNDFRDEHELEQVLAPCLIHEAMQKQALYSFALFFRPAQSKVRKKGEKLGAYKVPPPVQKRMQKMREERLPNGVLRYTIKDIAKVFNVSQGTVKNHTQGTSSHRGRTSISDQVQAQIKHMRQQGYTQQHIADSLGISKSTVERYG